MNRRYRFTLFYLLVAATWGFLQYQSLIVPPEIPRLTNFPSNYSDWHMTSQTIFSKEIISALKATDYLSRKYIGKEYVPVDLYIGYHDGGNQSGEIHSPKHCLPGNGWQQLKSEKITISVLNNRINAVKAIYQKGDNRELFIYWFATKGKTFTSEYSLKIAEVTGALKYGRRDAAFVRISVPLDADEERAAVTSIRFIKDFYPLISSSLPF